MNSHTNDLLDKFKTKNNIASDYAAAKSLGIRPNRISNYRTGVSHADDKTAVMLADALGLDRLQTIARINMDRARDSEEKTFWKRIANAAAIAILAMSVMVPASPARASENARMVKPEQSAVLYIMRNYGYQSSTSHPLRFPHVFLDLRQLTRRRLLLTQLLRADQALLGGLQQASGLIRKTDVVAEKPSGPLGCPGSGTAVGSR